MSLGLTRDSIGNLATLDKSFGKNDQSSIGSHASSQEEGESSEISLGFKMSDRDDDTTSSNGGTKIMPKPNTYGQYSGFQGADYADYSNYGVTYGDSYSSSLRLGEKKGNEGGFWCCVFPWASKQIEGEDEPSQSSELESVKSDDVSTGSAAYGEKLTENERAAVLARLHLASPEMADPEAPIPGSHHHKQKGLLDDIDKYEAGMQESKKEEKDGPKSILRRSSKLPSTPKATLAKKDSTDSKADAGRRRSLFPQQYEKKPKTDKHVGFAPMARVVTVKSKNEMSGLDKSMVWWQKPDYDDFKKTGRIIARAMCEGGSEIWLTSTNALARGRSKGVTQSDRAIHSHDRSDIDRSRKGNHSPTNGDKWWHTFGHSRRGLEHIASVDEGRQRQANVRIAIRIVIDEQRRQKIYRKEDPEKLRMLSLQYSTWARDLALAAAASDAEAVQLNFDEKRKSREYYILKNAKNHVGVSKQLPSFMQPVGRSPQVLDQHTSSQVRYRRKQTRVAPQPQKSDETTAVEPIHDARGQANLSKKAAGFGTMDADVSAILSGMGVQAAAASKMAAIKPQAASVGAH
mmetsp:Transcript_17604/g.29173  ORF Transcript_17604/g.29173 Transcript_17604/m.29173 type:complete len:574 (+) Transcript_17604:65-1786(+)|eukprot:CAMPEP_0119007246 /NCGR_PEP_ID=MMETSP1176-20130426/2878_1 /TAXON_ID=265551 /ORGANISM="Synedropsis recta cf, Strain CCMP1620" /LENGTH=573 /DNA_ID=CAMNT_0006959361 /DNA_START=41 /DNA_END=1762 /DNA_ORIENTATION=+